MLPNAKCHGDLAENIYSTDPERSLQLPEENPLTVPVVSAFLNNHFNKGTLL